MENIRIERVILAFTIFATIGFIAETIAEGWELWAIPLFAAGIAALCVMYFRRRMEEQTRYILYFVFGASLVFFHGIHVTSQYDVAVVIIVFMVTVSMTDSVVRLTLAFIEYFVIMGIQLSLLFQEGEVVADSVFVSGRVLHTMAVLLMYLFCRLAITNRREVQMRREADDARIKESDRDTEDFLSNISHELRTPINVINGMSVLSLKKGPNEEVEAISQAGLRLARQVEDIQDYTEIKRGGLVLEEEKYMATSLINDVIANYNSHNNSKALDLAVDLDPGVPTMLKGDIKKIHKIFRHLLENALKFTRSGGIYIRMYTQPRKYGVNLVIEMSDTGIGMSRKTMSMVSKGLYQANKKRNRSTGGIGIGLPIVYGFVRKMGGFVKIESIIKTGTTVRVVIPQEVIDQKPCLSISSKHSGDVVFFMKPTRYSVPEVREFRRRMSVNLANGLKLRLFFARSEDDLDRLLREYKVSHIFTEQEDYEENRDIFDLLSREGYVIAVSADDPAALAGNDLVTVMPKPIYGFPIVRVLNEGKAFESDEELVSKGRPVFTGVSSLIVDDEPMNLVVASGLLREYRVFADTAESGKEAIEKYTSGSYDVIFMDHMMPGMDGVETMKNIRKIAGQTGREPIIIALTANALSGAREMFMKEGFDGFIAKPIDIADFERVMTNVLPAELIRYEGRGVK